MLVLVTGKSGSGKSTFAQEIAKQLNYLYVDVDKIGHSFYNNHNNLKQIENLFGKDIYTNGTFDRKKLGKLVFENKGTQIVDKFNKLTYKYICNKIDKLIANNNAVLDWILLPQTKYWKMQSYKVLVKSQNDKDRFNKLLARDNVSLDYLILRDKSAIQYSDADFNKIIVNDYNYQTLLQTVHQTKAEIY